MKKSASIILVILLAAIVQARAQSSAVGSWDITIESPQGKRESVLIIKKEGDKLTGALKSPRGERPLESVTVNGNEITFTMKAQIQGQDMVFTYKGKIEKDSMKGDADFGGFATGTWSAVPHKEGAAAATPAQPAPATPPETTASNVTGVWNFTVETPNGTGTPVFTLKQEGENINGTYKGQLGESPVKGTIKGSDIKLMIKLSVQGQDLEITYTGKVEGSSMKGTAKFGDFGEGNWTAKKQ
jgi:hypothetical protein